ncbi:hypothetical protein [Kaistia soli]|uniref:hypothetical protein n=1 Tax=Kaistia soli TaxID=446684 RepID=UPI001114AD42|nr:hypothetical protein [Kaistia soli]
MVHEPVFYDCEASTLGGVPIEVGWAFMDSDGLVVSTACLVRPPRQWQIEARWDPAAEALRRTAIADLAECDSAAKPPC